MVKIHVYTFLQPLFNAIARIFIFLQLTPNSITLFALISGIFAAICIASMHLYWALCFLILSGILDILDGTVARLTNKVQKIGAYFDLIADRMVEAAFIVGLAFAYPLYYLSYLFFFVALLLHFSTFVVAGALFPNMSNKSMHYDRSFIERPEAFLIFALILIFPLYLPIILNTLNIALLWCSITRFLRVLDYAKTNV